MKELWWINKQLETQFTKKVEAHKKTIAFNTNTKTKLVGTTSKLQEFKYVVQTLDKNITRLKWSSTRNSSAALLTLRN
jgi:hypothetical protein